MPVVFGGDDVINRTTQHCQHQSVGSRACDRAIERERVCGRTLLGLVSCRSTPALCRGMEGDGRGAHHPSVYLYTYPQLEGFNKLISVPSLRSVTPLSLTTSVYGLSCISLASSPTANHPLAGPERVMVATPDDVIVELDVDISINGKGSFLPTLESRRQCAARGPR